MNDEEYNVLEELFFWFKNYNRNKHVKRLKNKMYVFFHKAH